MNNKALKKVAARYLAAGVVTGLVATQVDGMEPVDTPDWLRYISLWPAAVPILVIALAFTYLPEWALDLVFGKETE